jgi:hypothetical protein
MISSLHFLECIPFVSFIHHKGQATSYCEPNESQGIKKRGSTPTP